MFSTILTTLTEQGNGIHAYRSVARLAYRTAIDRPDQAAAFFLLATIADAFVERHERMPLLSKEAEQSFATFRSDLEALGAAYERQDTTEILAVLNRISAAHAADLI
ncbi:MAG TPA: hypothetical protein DEB47_22330 [Citreicella sp.]|jgi:hypothetical protein|nr:hypothetical protein [Citreicella sp.]|tara:strand:+ start:1641 stop:1961 length:321 start_codon:yes stop_codon:yes gene_type:complete